MKKEEKNRKMWAYFAPSGDVQVRSISYTKALARENICKFESYTYKDYEKKGFKLHKIILNIALINDKLKKIMLNEKVKKSDEIKEAVRQLSVLIKEAKSLGLTIEITANIQNNGIPGPLKETEGYGVTIREILVL